MTPTIRTDPNGAILLNGQRTGWVHFESLRQISLGTSSQHTLPGGAIRRTTTSHGPLITLPEEGLTVESFEVIRAFHAPAAAALEGDGRRLNGGARRGSGRRAAGFDVDKARTLRGAGRPWREVALAVGVSIERMRRAGVA